MKRIFAILIIISILVLMVGKKEEGLSDCVSACGYNELQIISSDCDNDVIRIDNCNYKAAGKLLGKVAIITGGDYWEKNVIDFS